LVVFARKQIDETVDAVVADFFGETIAVDGGEGDAVDFEVAPSQKGTLRLKSGALPPLRIAAMPAKTLIQ